MNSQQPHPLPDLPVVPTSVITHPSYESEMFGTWFRIVEVEEKTPVRIDQVERLFHQAGWQTWIRDSFMPRIVFVHTLDQPSDNLTVEQPLSDA